MDKNGVLAMLCAGAFCAVASAQTGNLSAADRNFMKTAAEVNMTEAHLGQMAQERASDEGVKSFGQTLVQDHTRAYEELTALATKTGESIPKGIDVRRDHAIEGLARDKGAGFDRSFVRHEVQDHQRTIAEFKREAEKGQNADVKAYAQKMIPALEEHLHKAEGLEKSEHRTTTASASRSR
jgi:putative membrane protein